MEHENPAANTEPQHRHDHHHHHHREHDIKSDIYAVTYAEVALVGAAASNSIVSGGAAGATNQRAGVFVIVHANGTVALVDPDTGLPLARYPHMCGVSLCGTGLVIADASIVMIGHSKKLGVRSYRVEARKNAAKDDGGRSVSPARGEASTSPLRQPIYSNDPAAPFGVALIELCVMPVAAEAVTAVAVAYMKTPLKCLVTIAFDTSSVLHMWALHNNTTTHAKSRSRPQQDLTSPVSPRPSPLRCELIAARDETTSPILCMAVCRGSDLWCGLEDGSVVAYRCIVNAQHQQQLQVGSSEDGLTSPPSRSSSFSVRPTRLIDSPLIGPSSSFSAFTRSVSPLASPNGQPLDAQAFVADGFEQLVRVPKAGRGGILSVSPLHRGRRTDEGVFVGAACVLFGTERGDILVFSSISFRLLREVRAAHGTSAIPAMCAVASLYQVYSISTDQRLVIWSVGTIMERAKDPTSNGTAAVNGSNRIDAGSSSASLKESATLERIADVSLSSDVSGSVYCLCYASQIGTVAGGGTQSELLCWFPSEQAPPTASSVDPVPAVEHVQGPSTPSPSSPRGSRRSSSSSSSSTSSISLSRTPPPSTRRGESHTSDQRGPSLEELSPPRASPPPTPTPKTPTVETPSIPPPPPRSIAAASLKLQLPPPPPQPTTGNQLSQPSLPVNGAIAQPLSSSTTASSAQTEPVEIVDGADDAALLRSELAQLLSAIDQMKDDHSHELTIARRGYADQFDATVLQLQAESALAKDELLQRIRELEGQLRTERAAHRERLEALKTDDSDVASVIAAYKVEIEHLSTDLSLALKQREDDTRTHSADKEAAVRAAREEERSLWSSRVDAQRSEAAALALKVTFLEGELEQCQSRLLDATAHAAAPHVATPQATAVTPAGVAHLLEALTSELRRLKSKHHGNGKSSGCVLHQGTQTEDLPAASPLLHAPLVEYHVPRSISTVPQLSLHHTGEHDTVGSLRRQLRLVETLLSKHHAQPPQHHSHMNLYSGQADVATRSVVHAYPLAASNDGGHLPSTPTTILTSVYFMMRDILGMALASEVLEGVLTDSTTSDEELTELVVLQLCQRLRGASTAPSASTELLKPSGVRGHGSAGVELYQSHRAAAERVPPSGLLLGHATTSGHAVPTHATHPMLRGYSFSPIR